MRRIILVRLLVLIFLLFPLSLFGQALPRDKTSGKIYYSEEVLVKDGPQQDLYHRAKAWFASPGKINKTLRKDDNANGILIGEINSELPIPAGSQNQTFKLWYTINLQLADDRYWFSLVDFQLQKLALSRKSDQIKNTPINKQPLETWLNYKVNVNSKGSNQSRSKLLEEAVYKSIFTQMEDLKAHLL